MRAVRNAPPTVEVVDVDEPEGDGELVRVAATGICASDLNYLQYGSTQIAGHEFAGVLADGTAVAVEAIFGCGACAQCEQGSYNRCERGPTALGMTDPGGMCEWFRAPRHALVPLPSGLDVKDASLVEPASVAWHSLPSGQIGPDTRVAVVGAGAIGILAAASAQTMGASDVAVEARHPHQHQARERIGATAPRPGLRRGRRDGRERERPPPRRRAGPARGHGRLRRRLRRHHLAAPHRVHERGGAPAVTRLLRPPRAA